MLGRTGLKNPDFRLWHAILRTIAVFLAPRTVFMSVKPVRWPKKMVVVLSTHVGRQRAHPLVPNLNLKKAVFYNWPPLQTGPAAARHAQQRALVQHSPPQTLLSCRLNSHQKAGRQESRAGARRCWWLEVSRSATRARKHLIKKREQIIGKTGNANQRLASGWSTG